MGVQDREYMRRAEPTRRARSNISSATNWTRILGTVGFFLALIAGGTYAFQLLSDSKFVVPFPATGEAFWYTTPQPGDRAKLTITAPPVAAVNYAVRLDEWESHRPIAMVPVRAGEVGVIDVPLGRYRITIAKGLKWQGPERLFGTASEIQEAVDPMEFYRVGTSLTGHTISLDSSLNGNMATRSAGR